ncbi:MFS transporter [Saccharibacillus sp. CPCC 101409]|uniref:MFS transporter n=1 Tax=Saccharibacillus sp. CPCC 101409 TaxID=3058041 RepID=UPI0026722486|nr:MFS transporter [Saccharibacillus sp. CPCC 101409]MDO3413277.1 MFS transporter [Saccharibacillus sp. CPCC 101409]
MATWFLIVIYLAFISLGLPDSLLGSAWPVMQPDLGAPLESAGLLSMTIAAGTIVSSLASGKIIERLGTGLVTLISCLMTAGALLGFSFAPSLGWLVLLAIPLGLGAGAVDAGLNHYVATHYKAHHMSWLHCFWGVGATLGPILMSFFIKEHDSWRQGYTAVALIQFGLVVVLLATLPLWRKVAALHGEKDDGAAAIEPEDAGLTPEELDLARRQPKTPVHPLRLRGVKMSLLAFLFYCGVETTVGLWGASFLVGSRGVSAQTAAGWISLYYGGITLGRLITGFITLKVNNRVLILAGQLIAALGALLLLIPLPDTLTLAGFMLIGIGLAPIYPGLLHETPARFGRENSARLMGYQMAVAYTGTTLLPPLFGVFAGLAGIGWFPAVSLLLVALMLLSSEQVNRTLKLKKAT